MLFSAVVAEEVNVVQEVAETYTKMGCFPVAACWDDVSFHFAADAESSVEADHQGK